MTRVTRSLAAFAVVMLAASHGYSAKRGPSTEAERQHAIELAQWLEHHPLDKDVKLKNTELMTWWSEVPDITFNWCAGILLEAKNERARGIVVMQALFSGGAYMLQHPEAAADREGIALAGVQSALRAYELVLSTDAQLQDEFLDSLLKTRGTDELREYVVSHLRECDKPPKK